MKARISILVALSLALAANAPCQGAQDKSTEFNPKLSQYAKTLGGVGSASYDEADVAEKRTFTSAISVNLSAKSVKSGNGASLKLNTEGVKVRDGVIISLTEYGISVNAETSDLISYELSGKLEGTLSLDSDADYQLYLNGVTIQAKDGPALKLRSTKRAFITLASGSVNIMSDAAERAEDLDMKAALYAKGRVILSGKGSLVINAAYKHGLSSSDLVRVRSGTVSINVSARDGIRTDNGFIMDDGQLTIVGTGTTVDDESKGIKVDGTEKSPGLGYVVINGGQIVIDTIGKAISAGWDIDEDADTADTADDPHPDLIVNNGVILITTTGTPYERTDAAGNAVSCSPEGLEAKSDLIINGGYIDIKSTDDCLNAGKSIVINDGLISAVSSTNDAIDSNGSLTIAGGLIVAVGGRGMEGPFDCDTNSFAVTGGIFVGVGGTTSQPSVSACEQNVLVAAGAAKGTSLAIKAEDGSIVLGYLFPTSAATLVASSPELQSGVEYSILTGGAASGGDVFNGLSTGLTSYSGGKAVQTFTPASALTRTGGQIFTMGPGGAGDFGGGRRGAFNPRDGGAFEPGDDAGFGPRGDLGQRPDDQAFRQRENMIPPDGWTPPDGFTPPEDWEAPNGQNPPSAWKETQENKTAADE